MLGNLSSLAFLRYQGQLDDIIIRDQDDSATGQPDAQEMESDATTEDPNEQSAHTPEPEPKAETKPDPEKEQPKYEKAQVREALANARLKGLNVANLIHEVGANSLSGVDPSRYGELMDNLAKALEGLG